MNLKKQAKEVLRVAQEHGVEQNFFFITTFERYQVQLNILDDLKRKIEDDGALVTKEYVKGRQNVVTNPAIAEYNKTASAANGTVSTLINILKDLAETNAGDNGLARFIAALNCDG